MLSITRHLNFFKQSISISLHLELFRENLTRLTYFLVCAFCPSENISMPKEYLCTTLFNHQ